jgi:hypothetical protein
MPHIHTERVEQMVFVGVADVRKQPLHRWRLRPKIARGPVWLLMSQCRKHSFS